MKLAPARPVQGFLLGYVCGILWYAGTCYWIFDTMRNFGGLNAAAAAGVTFLFCLYLGLYHGFFGLLVSLLARGESFSRRALLLSPAVWVAVELARTRVTGFPWDLLGISQVDNIPLARITTVTGVYGVSFEIMLVNAALAAAFLLRRAQRKPLLIAGVAAAVVLQSGRLLDPAPLPTDHTARLVQQNVPVLAGAEWTKPVFESTLRDLTNVSLQGMQAKRPDLIVWPESPAPFYTGDSVFREAMSNLARQANAWVVTGAVGILNASMDPEHATRIYNSAALVSPAGEWTARYDKIHLVPFGEYVPFKPVFSFAGGLTEAVGDFTSGATRKPLDAGGTKLGTFICYESIFPDEVRQFANQGAQVLVNLSNDGWYGDSGAYAQHLKQSRMRAVENARWLLLDTNTGVTAVADPYGRIVAAIPRKQRAVLDAPYQLLSQTTFYTRHGDWFAYLCAIISLAALLQLPFLARTPK
ncbi:MAG: apolipoprotein N-acyltransferase [Acidobacteriales bacterium]|nr:apolipoprotein N-acyltransferase [Terriglobales bacterium]